MVLLAVVRKHFVTTISPLLSVILLLHVKLEVENLASPAFNIKLYECDFVKTVAKQASEVIFNTRQNCLLNSRLHRIVWEEYSSPCLSSSSPSYDSSFLWRDVPHFVNTLKILIKIKVEIFVSGHEIVCIYLKMTYKRCFYTNVLSVKDGTFHETCE